MLITFKSRAGFDVIMFGKVGQKMLAVIGKDPEDTQGIVTKEQLPEAIEKLTAAFERDKELTAQKERAERELEKQALENPQDEQGIEIKVTEPVVSFAQRAAPLLELMRLTLKAKEALTWEAN